MLSLQLYLSFTSNRSNFYNISFTVYVQKLRTLFSLFSTKLLLIKAGIHKMLVKIANKEDPDQTDSSEAV